MIRYHLSLRQTDEKNKPKGHCGTGCESRSLYKVKKVLDNLCGWCYPLAVKSIDREKYHPIAAQRAGP